MKTAGARISDQEYQLLQEYAKSKGSNVNSILGNLAREAIGGSIEPKGRDSGSKIPYCPRCGFLMFFDFRDNTLACIKCGHCFEVETPSWQEGESLKI
jgi:ribosomal protein S27AE